MGAHQEPPGGAAVLEAGDTLTSLGHRHDLDRLEQLARPA